MNEELKISFEKIKDIKNDIENILQYINNKTNILTQMYNEYLKQINNTINYRISLDTFNFQTKLINIEHQNYTKIFKIFLNRMYGDYYKLYKKIVEYVKSEVKNVKIVLNNDYPKYKDLEISIDYSFDLIDNIFSEILSIILELSNYCLKENYLIKEIEKKQNNGININNFLNEKKYFIIILEQKINFYYEIINGYLSFQQKFCKRNYLKLKLIYTQISNDINLETSFNNDDNLLTRITSFNSFNSNDKNSVEQNLEESLEIELNKQLKNDENLNSNGKQNENSNNENGNNENGNRNLDSNRNLDLNYLLEENSYKFIKSTKQESTNQEITKQQSTNEGITISPKAEKTAKYSDYSSDSDNSVESGEYIKFLNEK